MDIGRFDIIEEPLEATYDCLLRGLAAFGTRGSLVLRDGEPVSEMTKGLLSFLAQCDLRRSRVSAWPGSQLLKSSAELLEFDYRCAVPRLCELTDRLYGWLSPELPEDLAVYRADRRVCLISCAHERFSELAVTEAEMERLVSEVPGLLLQRIAPSTENRGTAVD
jgi:hypothetical protein